MSNFVKFLDYSLSSKEIYSQAHSFNKLLPKNNSKLINLCESLLKKSPEYMKFISIWIKERKLFDLNYLEIYDRWLEEYIDNWALCDQYCYRILNPTIEKNFEQAKDYIVNWSKSDKIFVNRAAIVCMIYSGTDFEIHLPLHFVCQIINGIDYKKSKYINSAVGWILKYAYLEDSEYIMNYILSNSFNAIILDKAKEKMSDRDKDIIKNLKREAHTRTMF